MIENVRILLVEDETPKRGHIVRFLAGLGTEITVVVARSVNSALDSIETCKPDLILLDMSLPTFDVGADEAGGRPQGFGGTEILRHMTFAEIDCPTLVITGYEAIPRGAGKPVELSQLRKELEDEFPALFKGILHYTSTYDGWKIELRNKLVELGIISVEGP